ncbi:MAG: diacylglycerol kinase family lipid kinase [Rhodospirillales bacterium]|nr:diacylglycerol kinase family lipid kinase [Rhodospirillales bacterium]
MTESSPLSERTARRVLVIHNPTAGWRRRRRFERILSALIAEGVDVDVRPTTKRGDAEAFARSADNTQHDVIAVAGGDGTINEVVNGLGDKKLPLAVIPLGTANVLAHEIGLGGSPREIAETIAHGHPRPISVGIVNGRRFVMMAGFGFDAHVVAEVRPAIKKLFGKLAYVLSTLRTLVCFKFPKYRVIVDGVTYDVASAVIANGHYYGGTFVCAREARLEDPTLHVVLFMKPGALRTLRYAIWLALGRLDRLPDVKIVPATDIIVERVDNEPVQGDGDILANLPARITLAPAGLALLMPN